MNPPDLVLALVPVLDALRRLGVRHYVTGSLASSVHGIPRASLDADVVAELASGHAVPLIDSLRGAPARERLATQIGPRRAILPLASAAHLRGQVTRSRRARRELPAL